MRGKHLLAFVVIVLCSLLPMQAEAKVWAEGGMYIVDDATGQATVLDGNKVNAREEARRAALCDALLKVLDACAPGVAEKEGYAATREKLVAKAPSLIKGFRAAGEQVDKDGVMTLKGTCRISESALDNLVGPDVIAMLGNPRIMLFIDEMIGDKAPFVSTTEMELQRLFGKAGYLIVDPAQAKALLKLDPSVAFDDPEKLSEAARTLRADIIIVGRAIAGAETKQKVHGVTLYRVGGTVQLKAVLTQTAYQLAYATASQNTGKKPALSVGSGAERVLQQATSQATRQILYKIAYGMASVGAHLGGGTVNIKIADTPFQEVDTLEKYLKEIAGEGGKLFERSYQNNLLELDLVSGKKARDVANALAQRGIQVEKLTAQTIVGRIPVGPGPGPLPVPSVTVTVAVREVKSFEEEKIIEEAVTRFVGEDERVTGQYDQNTGGLILSLAFYKNVKTPREIAAFLNRPAPETLAQEFEKLKDQGVTALRVTGLSQDAVSTQVDHRPWW